MYRKPGSQSALSGVLSGPYTGGRKVIDVVRLEAATRNRVADALAGRGESTPIAHVRASGFAPFLRGAWALGIALVLITLTSFVGFDDPESTWAIQPVWALAIYLVAAALFAFGQLVIWRRRAIIGKGALHPGCYLLALDIVDVSLPDAKGGQRIELTPLGDARDAKVTTVRRTTELAIAFADATTRTFVLRDDATGEAALRRLADTQTLLEELTYVSELEKAFTKDPFFDLRVDKSWADVAPNEKEPAPRVSWLFGRHGPIAAGVLALALGGSAFAVRNMAGDRALFTRAVRAHSVEALDVYLARGGRQREEAKVYRQLLVDQREREARARAEREAAEKKAAEGDALGALAGEASKGSRESCAKALASRASSSHPEVASALQKILTSEPGDPVIPFRFKPTIKRVPPMILGLEEHLRMRRLQIAHAFERVFSEVCAGSVLRFVYDAADKGTALEVAYEVSWPAGDDAIKAMNVVFDIDFHGGGEKASFRLTMPEAKEAPTTTRQRSIFSIRETATGDARVLLAMTARAFDRLYDELWSLFFAGDPRVPVRDDTLDNFGRP